MTQRVGELRERINSVRQLNSAVSALRGMAAAHVQQSRGRLSGVAAYAEIISRAISQALALQPERSQLFARPAGGKTALLLFCAEQGFAGAFSDRVFDEAGDALQADLLLLIGSRGLQRAEARGLRIEWSAPMVSQPGGVADLAVGIVAALEARFRQEALTGASMIFLRPTLGAELSLEHRRLLPVDLKRFGMAADAQPPLINLAPDVLLERLAAEYLFAQISEAILHSFAAENTARLAAMAAARENIGRKLEALGLEERVARQSQITDELVELAAGAEALKNFI